MNVEEMDDSWLIELKSNMDRFVEVSIDDYRKIKGFLNFKKYPKGTVIKDAGQAETCARFILNGNISFSIQLPAGRTITRLIFFPGEVALDPVSFNSGNPSDYVLKAISDVMVCEIDRQLESKIINDFPSFFDLSIKVNHAIQEKLITWFVDFLSKPAKEVYNVLAGPEQELGKTLMVKDMMDILGVSKSTLANIRKIKD
ncbi:Crp/Fnr family transcriptional regulator [Fontibacter flavus]|uniref:Crp/Fnr family transcriptional regulator n=1 Tax=Fontibacter flavus TaxID=654838 RepID=A0ABV6FNG2_9BACT